MGDEREYDISNPKSIERYAVKLIGKTFIDVVIEKGYPVSNIVEKYGNKNRKGGLGNLLEEIYFGYKANSDQNADFREAGVELKVSPYEVTKKGELRAGERLVLTMISYDEPVQIEFFRSHLWDKMRLLLLIFYFRDKLLDNNLLYRIGFVNLFTPPAEDLEIIKKDYAYIIDKIMAGRAHELSEGDTMYLGACTKGATAEKSTVPQYYGGNFPAKKRAFCLKNSYMTYVLNHYIVKGDYENAILKDIGMLKERTFEEVLTDIIARYIGKSDRELCEMFGREYNNNKAQWNDLICKMLGIRDVHADEFEKANIKVKTIRIEEDGSMRENMSFPPFRFMDIAKENYEDSALHDYFGSMKKFVCQFGK